jgi:hypothetical protein
MFADRPKCDAKETLEPCGSTREVGATDDQMVQR